MDKQKLTTFINNKFDKEILPTLCDYIKIPNLSKSFFPEGKEKECIKLQDEAVTLLMKWVEKQGFKPERFEENNLSPLILIDIPATKQNAKTVLMYGHLDKQPPSEGWNEGLGPYKPVIKDGKLYGRGGADDGYAVFGAITAIQALQEQKIPHARIFILIEASEESGSPDLKQYLKSEKLRKKIGTDVDLVVCLDSGCGNYDQLWLTTSLRGIVNGNLKVSITDEGVHSGSASGIVPDTFRIARMLLSRLEDEKTGKIIPKQFYTNISTVREQQTKDTAEILGETIFKEFPFLEGAKPVTNDLKELLLNRALRPQLAVTGANGLPLIENAGNVLRPSTTLRISMRLPPGLDSKQAFKDLKELFEKDPPYNAKVTFEPVQDASGWQCPELSDWLSNSVDNASKEFFGKKVAYLGEGGSIPFMGILGEMFPKSQFLVTGILGPKSNAHGPNEFLHIDFTKKLIACVAKVVADHEVHTNKA